MVSLHVFTLADKPRLIKSQNILRGNECRRIIYGNGVDGSSFGTLNMRFLDLVYIAREQIDPNGILNRIPCHRHGCLPGNVVIGGHGGSIPENDDRRVGLTILPVINDAVFHPLQRRAGPFGREAFQGVVEDRHCILNCIICRLHLEHAETVGLPRSLQKAVSEQSVVPLHGSVFEIAKMEHLGIVTVTQIAERPAQIILGLSQLGPEHIRKSAVPTPFALSAALSLHEPYIRSVSGHNPAALLDFLISRIGIVFIVMIGDGVKKIGFTPFFKLFDKGLDPLRISLRQANAAILASG